MEINVAEEDRFLLSRYRALLRKARPLLKDGDGRLIGKAFRFAMEAHKDMRRRSGEPFVYHPVEVAHIVADEIGLGTTSIIAALLHDVVEDTEYTLTDIEERFGKKISRIIDGLTKISITTTETTSIQAENFRKMLLTISEDTRVVLIKISDRLHNMRTLESMPKDKQLKIKAETEYLYAPLAHRLGLYKIKSELEDLALKYADRKVYDEIVDKLKQTKVSRTRFTRQFAQPIEASLREMGIDFKIKMRTKSIRSIYDKMQKQSIPFEEVYDLFAIRIIFKSAGISAMEEKSLCWNIYSIVTDYYTPNTSRLRDWISVPKSNGYESLHITVMSKKGQWVEVQIRSDRMDDVAEKGYAAHWKYKEQGKSSEKTEQSFEIWLENVRDSIEQNNFSAMEFLDSFRTNLFNKEVFVFTPKGDLKFFPAGATVLDFAFDIHTEVGACCMGARVNGKFVSFNHPLKNGMQVEIITAAKPQISANWLDYATTSKAKNKIRGRLREGKNQLIQIGKETIARKIKQMKIEGNTESVPRKIAKHFNLKNEKELYYQIGAGLINHNTIKQFQEQLKTETIKPAKPQKNIPENNFDSAKTFKKEFQKIRQEKNADELVIGENMNDLVYALAPCCNPICGDDIFGFIKVSGGISIHKTSCKNAVGLMARYGNRIIKARWSTEKDHFFDTKIEINGTNREGLLLDISRSIQETSCVTMNSVSLDTDNNKSVFRGGIEISVKNVKDLNNLTARLKEIQGVEEVVLQQ